MITVSSIIVHDITAGRDTAIELATDGTGVLNLDQLPKLFCLKFTFSGRFAKSYYWLDSQSVADQQWSAPYCFPGKVQTMPPLSAGAHTMKWAVDLQQPQSFVFQVSPGAAQQANQVAPNFAYGSNLLGASSPACDPVLHPEIPAALKAIGATWVRLWLENDQLEKMGDGYWTICRAYEKLGFFVFLQFQYQYSTPKFSMCPDAVLRQIGTAVRAGGAVAVFSLGNETNTPAYCSGTIAELVHAASVIGPILRTPASANIPTPPVKLAGPSALVCGDAGLQYLRELDAFGMYALVDIVDLHSYRNSVSDLVLDAAAGLALANTVGLGCFLSEFNRRQNGVAESAADWSAAMALGLAGLSHLGLTAIQFSLVPANDPLDPPLLTSAYQANEPFFSANKLGGGGVQS